MIYGSTYLSDTDIVQDAMRRGVEKEDSRKRGLVEEMQRRDEERMLRARDRAVIPFKDALVVPSPAAGGGAGGDSVYLEKLDAKTLKLIESGLMVPKWHLDKEPLSNPINNFTGL